MKEVDRSATPITDLHPDVNLNRFARRHILISGFRVRASVLGSGVSVQVPNRYPAATPILTT